jgi:hypothetical protein
MTSLPSNLPATITNLNGTVPDSTLKANPLTPGAYIINSERGAFPIFSTISVYNDNGFSNVDNSYLIMPGYSITIYKGDRFTETSVTLSNETGKDISYQYAPYGDGGSSCRLYYHGKEILIYSTSY